VLSSLDCLVKLPLLRKLDDLALKNANLLTVCV
jgi:hypothetical protein